MKPASVDGVPESFDFPASWSLELPESPSFDVTTLVPPSAFVVVVGAQQPSAAQRPAGEIVGSLDHLSDSDGDGVGVGGVAVDGQQGRVAEEAAGFATLFAHAQAQLRNLRVRAHRCGL